MGDPFSLSPHSGSPKKPLRTQRRRVIHKTKGKEGSELLPRAITPLSADPRSMEAWIRNKLKLAVLFAEILGLFVLTPGPP